MTSQPLVYVVILNWNKNDITLQCIRTLMRSSYKNFEIVLVDNAPIEKLEPRLHDEFPKIAYIYNPKNLGFTGGCNQGMQFAMERGADYIWLLNNDTDVPVDCLEMLVNEVENNKNIGLLSPIIFNPEKPTHSHYGSYMDVEKGLMIMAKDRQTYLSWVEKEPEKIWLWGTALLINSRLIEKIGYLDNDFFAYFEDNDYSLRSIRSGYLNKVCLNAHVIHNLQIDPISEYRSYYYFLFARNRYLFWFKAGLSKNRARYLTLRHMLPKIVRWQNSKNEEINKAYIGGLWQALCRHEFGQLPLDLNAPEMVYRLTIVLAKPILFFLRKFESLQVKIQTQQEM